MVCLAENGQAAKKTSDSADMSLFSCDLAKHGTIPNHLGGSSAKNCFLSHNVNTKNSTYHYSSIPKVGTALRNFFESLNQLPEALISE